MNTPSLTAVLHEDFKNPPSGLTGYTIADLIDKNYQTLMSELSRQQGHKLGADLVLPLMQKTGSTRALDFLAREMGGVFVPVPDPAQNPFCIANTLVSTLASSIKEFGDFASETAQNLADGKISKKELARITNEGREAIVAIMSMMKLAKATHENDYENDHDKE